MGKHTAICYWPKNDRPRERLLGLGAAALSDTELIALLLGTGKKGLSAIELARQILAHCGGLHVLARHSAKSLGVISGLGPAKIARVLAACELGRRRERDSVITRDMIREPKDAARIAASYLKDCDRECFLVFLLDTKHHILREEWVSLGTLDQAPVHPRDVFRPALEYSASALVLSHNHPSGDPAPSREDIQVTERLQQGAKLFGIQVLDHVIIGLERYFSFAESGLMKS